MTLRTTSNSVTKARLARITQGRYATARDLARTAGFEKLWRYTSWEKGAQYRYLTPVEVEAVADLLEVQPYDIAEDNGSPRRVSKVDFL